MFAVYCATEFIFTMRKENTSLSCKQMLQDILWPIPPQCDRGALSSMVFTLPSIPLWSWWHLSLLQSFMVEKTESIYFMLYIHAMMHVSHWCWHTHTHFYSMSTTYSLLTLWLVWLQLAGLQCTFRVAAEWCNRPLLLTNSTKMTGFKSLL